MSHLTRLETRTKESAWLASRKAVLKALRQSESDLLPRVARYGDSTFEVTGSHERSTNCGRTDLERAAQDPKDGDLCSDRVKPRETMVEARSGSDVQIDRLI